jgi:HK97 family phage portal protein
VPQTLAGRVSSVNPSLAALLGWSGWAGGAGPYVVDAQSARHVPAVGRAIQLFGGMAKQMPLELYRSGEPVVPTPRLLKRPDPTHARSWFVQVSIEDYLLNGNAIGLITSRGLDGWPLSMMWLPAEWVSIMWQPQLGLGAGIVYNFRGVALPFDDVIHVQRGADRLYPVRGVGVVEEYLSTLDRAALEEEYERQALSGAGVPSVAVITPQAQLSEEIATEAKEKWVTTFAGPGRAPVILPNGTQVVPLAWSPTDAQLIEARKLTLLDVANCFNLDGYWLGAPVAGMTYRTAAPQYQQILRTSLEPVIVDFEDVWSDALVPRGSEIRFSRAQLLREDLFTTAQALNLLVTSGIITADAAQLYLALPTKVPLPHAAAAASD